MRREIAWERLINPLYQRWRLQPITGKANRIASHSRVPTWRRGGSSICNVVRVRCKRTYMCKRLQGIDGKVAGRGYLHHGKKNTAFQCGYSRNAVSEPCMVEQQCTNYHLSLFYFLLFSVGLIKKYYIIKHISNVLVFIFYYRYIFIFYYYDYLDIISFRYNYLMDIIHFKDNYNI